jgi:hypothetical protein
MKTEEFISQLEYIASSPEQKHGGFHPNVIATAKEALSRFKQEEKPIPDAEGWWWRNGVRPKCYYLITGKPSISLPGYMEYQDECDCIGRVLIKGSWIKAIVPEFKEE